MERDTSIVEEYEVFLREVEEELARVEEEVEKKYEEARESLSEYIARYVLDRGLQRIYLVEFRLPSRDLGSRVEERAGGREELRMRGLSPRVQKAINNLRSKFYYRLHRNGAFLIGERTWAVLEGALPGLAKDLESILEEFNGILVEHGYLPRNVTFVEMHAPTGWIIEQITRTIKIYRANIEDLINELKNEELSTERKRLLRAKAARLRSFMKKLKEQLKQLLETIKHEERAKKYINLELLQAWETEEEEETQDRTRDKKPILY